MAFSIEKLKAAFVRAWKGDEPKHATTEAELEQFWIPQPAPTYGVATLPVSSNVIVSSSAPYHYANGHIGAPPLHFANTVLSVSELEQIEIEVEESTESEIANMGKSKEPERKRFKTIAMAPPPQQKDAAPTPTGCRAFRVFQSTDGDVAGVGECDTLEDARLMVKAKFGRLQKASVKKLPDRRVDIVNYGGGIEETYAS